jgi:NAD-specific glutamate dehydrogenase
VPELDGNKTKLVQKAKAVAGEMLDVAEQAAAKRVIAEFYQYVPPADVSERDARDLCGAALLLWRFAERRRTGRAKIRVYNPDPAADGWSSPHTIVEIVNDDMQFLVDSVCLAINASRRFVHLVIFSILTVARDLFGQLREILDGGVPGLRESWMQIGITRESDRGDLARLAQTLSGVHGRRSQTVARSDPKGVGGPQKREQKLHQKFLRLDQKSQLLDEQMRKLRAAGRSGGRSTGWYRNSGNAGPSSRSRSDTRSRPRYL